MTIVLDTGVFWNRAALEALAERADEVVLPAVAAGERARQLFRDKRRSPEEFHAFLEALAIDVAPMGFDHATLRTHRLADGPWTRLARDAFIAGHVGPGDELWTSNARDFLEVGVPAERLVTW